MKPQSMRNKLVRNAVQAGVFVNGVGVGLMIGCSIYYFTKLATDMVFYLALGTMILGSLLPLLGRHESVEKDGLSEKPDA